MLKRLCSGDPVMALVWAAAVLSFAFWPIVPWLGVNEPPPGAEGRFITYFQMANWWAYPFFFLGIAPLLWLSWQPLVSAWARLAETDVLRTDDGRPDEATIAAVQNAVRRRRGIAVVSALVMSLAINVADRMPLVRIYSGQAGLAESRAHACAEPSAFYWWILAAHPGPGFPCAELKTPTKGGGAVSDEASPAPPAGQIVFASVTALQQVVIVFFAALAILQVLLHTALFAVFEQTRIARAHGLRLTLNCSSTINEFGLEHWNYAMNNFYWAASPALFGVFLSRAATPPEDYLPGQVLLGVAVPLCILVPMIATIIVRQARLPEAWKTIAPDGPVTVEDFRRQQLWPLDRNWTSKLGIVLALVLATLALGYEVVNFVPF